MADSFEPLATPEARVLVLGTVPSRESLRLGQYYANPRNVFWRIMMELFGDGAEGGADARSGDGGELDHAARARLVARSGVALWDVLASARREGSSLDAKIERHTEVANDIAGFLEAHSAVTHVFLNGAKAAEVFERRVAQTLPVGRVRVRRLPSTSPANAATSYADKLAAWRAVADAADGGSRRR